MQGAIRTKLSSLSVKTFYQSSGFYKSHLKQKPTNLCQLSPSKMVPYRVMPGLSFHSSIMQLTVKSLAIITIVLKCRLQHFVCDTILVQVFSHHFSASSPKVDDKLLRDNPFMMQLLWMVRLDNNGYNKSLEKILFMARTSSNAQ